MQVLQFIKTLEPAVQQHLAKLASDPTRKMMGKALGDQWQAVMEAAGQIEQQVQQMMEQQAQQQQEAAQATQKAAAIAGGFDPETQIKAADVAAKTRLAQQKTAAAMQMKAQKHMQDMALADASTAADIRRQNALAASKTSKESDSE